MFRYFDEDAFEHVSAEARDFVTNLLIRERRWEWRHTENLLKLIISNSLSTNAHTRQNYITCLIALCYYNSNRLSLYLSCSGRLSAAQCLKHPWLNNISEKAKSSNIVLKSQVLLKKYMARRMWKVKYCGNHEYAYELHKPWHILNLILWTTLVHILILFSFLFAQKNYIAIAAANRFKKIGSSGSLTSLAIWECSS